MGYRHDLQYLEGTSAIFCQTGAEGHGLTTNVQSGDQISEDGFFTTFATEHNLKERTKQALESFDCNMLEGDNISEINDLEPPCVVIGCAYSASDDELLGEVKGCIMTLYPALFARPVHLLKDLEIRKETSISKIFSMTVFTVYHELTHLPHTFHGNCCSKHCMGAQIGNADIHQP